MTTIVANTIEQVERFGQVIYGPDDLVELRLIRSSPKDTKRTWRAVSEIPTIVNDLRKLNERGYNIYFGINPRRADGGSTNDDVLLARVLFVDFDGVALAEVRRRIDEATLPTPTLIINSGHGYHAYWRLDEPLHDLGKWRAYQQGLIEALDSDPAIKDAARIMRVPGFLNTKADPVACDIVEGDPARQYPIDEFPCPALTPTPVTRVNGQVNKAERENALRYLGQLKPGRADPHQSWLSVGMILHSVDPGDEMLRVWDHWSRQSGKWEDGACANRWATFNANGRLRIATLHAMANEDYRTGKPEAEPTGPDVIENVIQRADPIPLAEHFIDTHHRDADGRLLLRRHRADFYAFAGSCYQPLTDEEIDAAIYKHLEHCSTIQRDGSGAPKLDELGEPKLRPITPRSAIVREVRLALPSRGVLLGDRLDPPCWLTARDDLDPTKIVPCRNGLLDLATRTLHALTPELFSTHALPFDFDPDAGDPVAWEQFLDELWENDAEAYLTLQQWFGYCLSGDTRQHKILMICGPKRSGKGTIARVLTGLLGAVNVAAPPLGSLATNFGLQPLLTKLLAIVSDARLSGRTDQAIVVERLLSISGEDSQTIDRKHKAPVTVKLPTRFMLLTNELPRLRDTSGALPSRFIILTLTESWYGREDHDLTDKLLAELPSILLWALDGWAELQEQGHFTQPGSSADAIRELEDLSSPMGAFLRDRCETGPGCSIDRDELFGAWKSWCEEQGRDRPGTKATFGRDLRAAVPTLRESRPRTGGGRSRRYESVTLRDDCPGGPGNFGTTPPYDHENEGGPGGPSK